MSPYPYSLQLVQSCCPGVCPPHRSQVPFYPLLRCCALFCGSHLPWFTFLFWWNFLQQLLEKGCMEGTFFETLISELFFILLFHLVLWFGYRTLGQKLFYFGLLEAMFYCLLASSISLEKSKVIRTLDRSCFLFFSPCSSNRSVFSLSNFLEFHSNLFWWGPTFIH